MSESVSPNEIKIKYVPAMSVLSIEHKGPLSGLQDVFDELLTWVMREGHPYIPPHFAIIYDDPRIVPAEDIRSEACIQMGEECRGNDRVRRRELAPLTMATLLYKGPYADAQAAYEQLFKWVAENGFEYLSAFGCREKYLNFPIEHVPSELLTEIQVPIKKKA